MDVSGGARWLTNWIGAAVQPARCLLHRELHGNMGEQPCPRRYCHQCQTLRAAIDGMCISTVAVAAALASWRPASRLLCWHVGTLCDRGAAERPATHDRGAGGVCAACRAVASIAAFTSTSYMVAVWLQLLGRGRRGGHRA